jgi:hypothetical protein
MTEVELSERAAEHVAVGKDGYLFVRHELAFEQVSGEKALYEAQAQRWADAIKNRIAWCAARGIVYLFVVVPEKNVVYEDRLPAGAIISAERPAMQILAKLGTAELPHFLYPLEDLRAAETQRASYFKTDSHWSRWGGYIGYRAIMNALAPLLNVEPIQEEALDFHNYTFIGDLGAYLDPEPFEQAIEVTHAQSLRSQFFFSNSDQINGMRGQVHIYLHEDDSLPRIVMFRDSGANSLFQFLNTHFSRMVALAIPEFDVDVIESEKPQVVITEIAERFLFYEVPAEVEPREEIGLSRVFESWCKRSLPLPVDRSIFKLSFRFEMENLAPILCEGWFGLGTRQIWSCGPRSVIRLPDLPHENLHLRLDLMPLHNAQGPVPQRLDLRAEGGETVHYVFNSGRIIDYDIPAAAVAADGSVTLVLDHPDGVVPAHAPHEPDLSFIILALWVLPGREEV